MARSMKVTAFPRKHGKRRVDIEVIERGALFPHDVVALVKMTDEGHRQMMELLADLKPNKEIIFGATAETDGIAFQRGPADKVAK